MKYWLFITNKNNLENIQKSNVYGFNSGSKRLYNKINVGDKIILYLIPKRIVGFYKVKEKDLKNKISFNEGVFSSQLQMDTLKILNEPLILNKELVEMISTFKNKKHWGVVLMGKSCVELNEEDYLYLFNHKTKNHITTEA
ncbi:MAG: EVE domain-containing protein [Candidatus Delongbacteria bacterium]|nr:EVE domain-containing protein [Candidatus Delongbacteria bacterium]